MHSNLFIALVCVLLGVSQLVSAKVYFKENFNDEAWSKRWTIPTKWKGESEMGKWKHTQGKFFGDAADFGVQTSEDAKHYGMSAKLSSPFSNDGKQLVVQFSVKHEQELDCGGAYIKLLHGAVDQDSFGGATPYSIMFGPDVCGSSNRRTHVIFNYPPKNDNLLIKEDVKTETDHLSHLYTLVVNPDNTFKVLIDQKVVREGELDKAWDFLLPKKIKDPEVKKPADWVDAKKIADPNDVKPDNWDDIPATIPDPEATKPDDWDDDEDGEWEAPMSENPDFKGEWKAKMIDNPDYKGEWKHPMIPNPDYKDDAKLHARCTDCTHVGFELWQVKSGTIFDDIIITDSIEEADAFASEGFLKRQGPEKAAFDKAEEERHEAEAAAREEAEAARKASGEGEGEGEEEEHEEHEEL